MTFWQVLTMAMDSWSKNEYRTFITSRRDDVFENRETSASAFSFKRPPPLDVGHSDYSERDEQCDADVKLHWEKMVRMALQKPPSTEFEFQFKSAPVSPMVASLSHPEDDVFQGSTQLAYDHAFATQRGDYKQHPVYRKQGEFDEASKRAPTFVVSQRTVPEPFSQLSPGSLSRMYQPKYSKFCVNSTDVPPVETSMDSRSSSFRSQTSTCEPTDRDTGDSSTGRDSNGSSNDASSVSTDTTFDRAFEAFEHRSSNATTPTLKSNVTFKTIPCPNDRRSVLTATNAEYEKASPNVSWLRSPLKWMGIGGAKKPLKSPRAEVRIEHYHRFGTRPVSKILDMSNAGGDVSKPRAVSRLFNPPTCDDKNVTHKRRSFLALPVHQPLGTKTVEAKSSHGLKLKPAFASDSSDVHSVVSSDRERDHSGMLKIRERWLKYMRILTPPYGKSSSKPDAAVVRGGSFPQQQTLSQEYVHTRPKSMPAILKTPPLRPRSNPGAVFQPSTTINIGGSRVHMPPAGPSSAKKSNSFLSHNVSSSPRLMKSSSPRLLSLSPKVKSSPKVANTISPRMSSSSASSMCEIHSAVQGAIAHCKQSHSGLLSPAGNPAGNNHRQ